MINNIFITGDKYVGKSTFLKNNIKKLNLKPGGFVVGRTGDINKWLSFYLIDPIDYYYHWQGEKFSNYKKKCQVFAEREKPEDKWTVYKEVFDDKGVNFLETAQNFRDIVVMDELGRFERNAMKFQASVFSTLDSSKPVLAVIKDEHNVFLDRLRDREDKKMYRLTKQNREKVFHEVHRDLKKIIMGLRQKRSDING